MAAELSNSYFSAVNGVPINQISENLGLISELIRKDLVEDGAYASILVNVDDDASDQSTRVRELDNYFKTVASKVYSSSSIPDIISASMFARSGFPCNSLHEFFKKIHTTIEINLWPPALFVWFLVNNKTYSSAIPRSIGPIRVAERILDHQLNYDLSNSLHSRPISGQDQTTTAAVEFIYNVSNYISTLRTDRINRGLSNTIIKSAPLLFPIDSSTPQFNPNNNSNLIMSTHITESMPNTSASGSPDNRSIQELVYTNAVSVTPKPTEKEKKKKKSSTNRSNLQPPTTKTAGQKRPTETESNTLDSESEEKEQPKKKKRKTKKRILCTSNYIGLNTDKAMEYLRNLKEDKGFKTLDYPNTVVVAKKRFKPEKICTKYQCDGNEAGIFAIDAITMKKAAIFVNKCRNHVHSVVNGQEPSPFAEEQSPICVSCCVCHRSFKNKLDKSKMPDEDEEQQPCELLYFFNRPKITPFPGIHLCEPCFGKSYIRKQLIDTKRNMYFKHHRIDDEDILKGNYISEKQSGRFLLIKPKKTSTPSNNDIDEGDYTDEEIDNSEDDLKRAKVHDYELPGVESMGGDDDNKEDTEKASTCDEVEPMAVDSKTIEKANSKVDRLPKTPVHIPDDEDDDDHKGN